MPKILAKCQRNYPQRLGRQTEVQIGDFLPLSRYILTKSSAIAEGPRFVTKFVLCFTRYGSYTGFKQQSDFQGYLWALAMVPFDMPHDFLLVIHCNYVCILHRFRDTITYFPKFNEVT